jgi:hypothetical protein
MTTNNGGRDALGELAEEFLARYRAGEHPALSDYIRHHPELADRIREVFPMLIVMEEVGSKTASTEIGFDHDQGMPVGSDLGTPNATVRYRILEPIGQGGMGAVLKGRDENLDREIAVKVLLQQYSNHPDLVKRFFREAQITAQLQHPGIPPIHAFGRQSDGRPFFAMKLIQGRTLEVLLAERADAGKDRPRLVKVFEQVCQAVAFAHSKKVVHRDFEAKQCHGGGVWRGSRHGLGTSQDPSR